MLSYYIVHISMQKIKRGVMKNLTRKVTSVARCFGPSGAPIGYLVFS